MQDVPSHRHLSYMLSLLGPLRMVTAIVLVVLAGALLWRPRRRDPVRLWLGVLLAVNAALVLGGVARSFGAMSPLDTPIAFSLLFAAYALSPLSLVLVVRAAADPRVPQTRDLRMFIPAGMLAAGLVAAAVAVSIATPGASIFAVDATWWIALAVLHGIALGAFVLTARHLGAAPAWMRALFAVFVVHWALSAASSVSALSGWPGALALETASLASLLLFGIGAGVAGVRMLAMRLPSVATFDERAGREPDDPADAALGRRLRTLFESDEVYLDENLTLDSLASLAGAAPRDVSRVLNTILGGGYHDVVRRYRVQRAQELMRRDPEATILGILYEAGFNSKSAFHRAFREQVGMSPGAWRDAARGPGENARPDRRPGRATS